MGEGARRVPQYAEVLGLLVIGARRDPAQVPRGLQVSYPLNMIIDLKLISED
jgi:hypothetical protein